MELTGSFGFVFSFFEGTVFSTGANSPEACLYYCASKGLPTIGN